MTLKDSRQPIDHNEVRRKFQQFGDVKSVTPMDDRAEYDAHFLLSKSNPDKLNA